MKLLYSLYAGGHLVPTTLGQADAQKNPGNPNHPTTYLPHRIADTSRDEWGRNCTNKGVSQATANTFCRSQRCGRNRTVEAGGIVPCPEIPLLLFFDNFVSANSGVNRWITLFLSFGHAFVCAHVLVMDANAGFLPSGCFPRG